MGASASNAHSHSLDHLTGVLAAHIPDTEPSKEATRNAAVAMVLREDPALGLAALFIQRAEHPDDPWSGQMAFPGGRHEPYDDSLEAAARRETKEEVGLELRPEMALGRLHDIYGGRLSQHRLAVSPFVFHVPGPVDLVHNYEVANTVWVPLEYMADPANVRPYLFPPDPAQRPFPSFQYGGYTIWGLTYRIISNYFRLFGIDHPGESEVTDVE